MTRSNLRQKATSRLRGIYIAAAALLFAASLGLTLWLYLGSRGDVVSLLLLELGPRWLLLPGFVPLLLAPITRRLRAGGLVIAAACGIALLDLRVVGCFASPEIPPTALNIGTYNTGGGFVPPTELLLWYDEQRLDVLLLQEMGRPERLRDAAASLGMLLACASKICALSQHAISGEMVLNRRDIGGWGGYVAKFTLCRAGSCRPLIALHLGTPRHAIEEVLGFQPWSKARAMLAPRDLESSLAALVTDDSGAIIAGDFNMTQQSPLYRRDWNRWQNAFASAGCGRGHTKLSRRLGARIDHILAGERWRVLEARVHASLGGDHRPVTASMIEKTLE